MSKERPILFSAPMVRALQAGTKTQTRRVVKPQPTGFVGGPGVLLPSGSPAPLMPMDETVEPYGREIPCPYGQPGDHLWVKETHYAWGHWTKRFNAKKGRDEWHFVDETLGAGMQYRYAASERLPRRKRELHEVAWWKRPAIFMPRAASRLDLAVTGRRVERLQDISEADAIAEGTRNSLHLPGGRFARENFAHLWWTIHGDGSWEANPWVWAITFKRMQP